MKRRILFSILFLFIINGCSTAIKCYELPGDLPKVCISKDFSLRAEADNYLAQGYSLLITKEFLGTKPIISSFYVKKENILFSKEDFDILFAQLWYIKNKTLPTWSLNDIRFFEIKDIVNFLNQKEYYE